MSMTKGHKFVGGYEIDPSRPNICQLCGARHDAEDAYCPTSPARVCPPREPTEEMLAAVERMRPAVGSPEQLADAGYCERWKSRHRHNAIEIWHAMYDADRPQGLLVCVFRGGGIDIGVGADALAFAAASHPEHWDGKSGPDVPNIKVDDPVVFAREVCAAINRESEDGSTLLTRMLDKAISLAVEDGCDGVDHDRP